MKKFLFTISIVFLTIQTHAEPRFTITCKNTAGDGCDLKGDYENLVSKKCSDIAIKNGKEYTAKKQLSKNNPIIVDVSATGNICAEEIKAARQSTDCEDNDIRHRYVGDYCIFFCESGGYLDTLGTPYDGIKDADWSYSKKKCVGSGGKWDDATHTCTCQNEQTMLSDDQTECLCNNGNQKYLLNGNCQEGATCTNTGGLAIKDSSKCECPDTMESVKMRTDSELEICQCKNGFQYRDPMRRWEGCVKTNGTVDISGTVQDHDTGTVLSNANLIIQDASLTASIQTITTENGSFNLQHIPNTAYVQISLDGYRGQKYPAIELNNKTIKLVRVSATDAPSIDNGVNDTNIATSNDYQDIIPTNSDGGEGYSAETYATENKETDLDKKLADAQSALDAARDAENSWANRGLAAASTAMTGLGGMQAASAFAEQRADAAAEKQMREYLATFKCDYGGGQEFNAGNEEITLPGGNELLEYYTEYKTLADNLKTTKAALGLRNGIESETLYDRAESGLYQYATAERKSGGEISLARALSDETSEDAARWAEQKEQTAKQLKTGAIVAGAGIVGGIVGNYLINERGKTKLQQKTDDVIEEIEERLPAFTYTPQTVVIQNPEEQKPTIYLGENNGRMQMPKLTNLSPRTKELTLNGDTTFARNSDKIKSDGTKKIDTFVTELKPILEEMSDEQKIKINIVGHTDRTGNDKINIPLSQRRAESVKKYLEEPNRLGGNAYKTKIEYSTDGRGSSECADNTCGDKKDCELCRKVVVTIEDISPKTEETE